MEEKMGRLEGKVALITGAARGQGRNHAVRMAREGADIVGLDRCAPIDTVPYDMPDADDLRETVRLVEAEGRRMLSFEADVRDYDAVAAAAQAGVDEFGHLDVAVANAGVVSFSPAHEMPEEQWQEMLGINLTGPWHTAKAVIPHMLPRKSGSIVITSSGAGLHGVANVAHYCAAKHGVVGLMKALALELAPSMIRVNTVNPTNVDTPMIQNNAMFKLFRPDLDDPQIEDVRDLMAEYPAMPVPWVEVEDVTNAVVYLASDEARYITGVALPVDAGENAG
jgi:(+)-trans-carveol dehydrogenase